MPSEKEIADARVAFFGSEFLVTIRGTDKATTLMHNDGRWVDYSGESYTVAAWMPLPPAWKGENQ